MSERDKDERGERRAAEGVRIIGPEEAQAALDAGQAAGRRPDDELRFGDVPPAPAGPRPPHRFPLPDSVDPAAAVPRPPVVPPTRNERNEHGGAGRVRQVGVEDAHDPRPWQERTGVSDGLPSAGDDPIAESADDDTAVQAAVPSGPGPDRGGPPVAPLPATPGPATPGPGATAGDATTVLAASGPLPGPRSASGGEEPSAAGAGTELAGAAPSRGGAPGATVDAPGGPSWATPPGDDPTSVTPAPLPAESPVLPPVQPPAYEGPWSERPASFAATPPAATGPAAPAAASPTATGPTATGYARTGPAAPAGATAASLAAATGPTGTPPPEGPPSSTPLVEGPPDLHLPDEGITVTGGFGTELPHWTDPPTGEVPRILPGPPADGGGDEDDLAAWEALGAQGTRWRDDATGGWDSVPGVHDLAEGGEQLGALDQSRTEHSDLYSFDEEFDRLEGERSGTTRPPGGVGGIAGDGSGDIGHDDDSDLDEAEPAVVGGRQPRTIRSRPPRPARVTRAAATLQGRRETGGPGADLPSRVAVGVGLVVALIIAYAIGPVALLVLATAVVLAAAVEVYGMLQRSGFRPATLLGLVATAGLMFGTYWRGVGAIPLIVALVFVASMLWYLLGVVEARPLANVAVTVTAFAWVGVLGSFAGLLLRSHHGKGLFIGAVLPAVAADIVAYFVGRQMGARLLAPRVSPAKTLEGAIGGGIAAIVVGLVVGHSVSPWGGTRHGLLLGIVVAVVAPVGDLFESMIKRDLDVKDSGSLLSGHGGVLDRFDSVLLVLPAAFYLATYFGVVR